LHLHEFTEINGFRELFLQPKFRTIL